MRRPRGLSAFPFPIRHLAMAVFAALLLAPGAAMAERAVDLELVLAADVSGSMDLEEARLQRDGYVRALRDPQVIQAIQGGRLGRIAVTYVEWAGEHYQRMLVKWTEISDAESADAFATLVERQPLRTELWTSISSIIDFAYGTFLGSDFSGRRRVIDISGDGPNNNGVYVVEARDRVVAEGVVINGLPIVNDRPSRYGFPPMPNLDLYYEDCVIGGPGAFIVVADGFQDFARAIRRKMVLEIAGASDPGPRVRPAADWTRPACDAGEKQLRQRMRDWDP